MNEKTTFSELIDKLSGRVDKSQGFTQEFMRELVSIIESGLKQNGSVSISGFGKFEVRWMDERKGTNPRTGEEIIIPGQNKIVFKPFKALREHVNLPYARMKPHMLDESPEDDSTDQIRATEPPEIPKDELSDEKDQEPEVLPPIQKSPGDEPDSIKPEPEESRSEQDDEPDDYEEAPFPFFIEEEEMELTDEEVAEELVVERESPEDYVPVSSELDKPGLEDTGDDEELVINFKETTTPVHESEDKAALNWTYVATAVAVLLVILLLFFIMNQQPEIAEPVAEPPITEAEPPPPVIEEPAPNDIEESEFIAIIISAGQNLWSLATSYLGDPYLWPWIYHLNIEAIDNPNQIYEGNDLTIPAPADTEQLTDSELREVATGYVDVYQWYRDHSDEQARFYLWAAGLYDISIYDDIEDQVDDNDLNFARNR
jgi:nucleoid DNA-binding protein